MAGEYMVGFAHWVLLVGLACWVLRVGVCCLCLAFGILRGRGRAEHVVCLVCGA